MHFPPPYKIKIKNEKKWSELNIQSTYIHFQCVIGSPYNTRNRRQFLLTIYQAIMPHLDLIKRSSIHHSTQHSPEIFGKDEFATLSIKQGIDVVNDETKIGYFIRGIRTKLGKTQVDFARELSVSVSYLSKMERGRRMASPRIMRKIYEMKKASENTFPEALNF
jgi:DNA-binding transcriptional regulator YiaG